MIEVPEFITNDLIFEWRQLLKKALLIQRGYKSAYSNKPLTNATGCHMHEGIVTRAMVPKSIWWHYKIFHPYNSVLLLPEEHIQQPNNEAWIPTREWCLEYLSGLYGIDNIRNWFYNELNWKVVPFKI